MFFGDVEGDGNQIEDEKFEAPRETSEIPHTPEEEYDDDVEEKATLEERLLDAKKSIEEDRKKIHALRSEMGLEDDESVDEIGEDHLQLLEEKIEQINESIENDEYEILDLPEGEGTDPTQSEPEHCCKEITMEEVEKLAEKEREKFLKSYAKESADYLISEWQSIIDTCENAKQAKVLIQKKTYVEIMRQGQEFVKNGTDAKELEFYATCKTAQFEQEGSKKYFVEYNMDFVTGPQTAEYSESEKSTSDEGDEEYEPVDESFLVDDQVQQEMDKAKEQGDLKEKTEKKR